MENIVNILLHGGSDTEVTFTSDYCCRHFMVEPSKTSLFFEQCLLLHSSIALIVTIYYRVLSGNCRFYSPLCKTPCSSYTSVSSSGTISEAADVPGAQAPEKYGFRRPQITPPKSFEVGGDRADNWKLWKQRWLNYCLLADLNDKSEDYK